MRPGKTVTLGQLAKLVDGKLIGDPNLKCQGASVPEETAASEITMLDDCKRVDALKTCAAMAVVTPGPITLPIAQIIVDDVHKAFSAIVAYFRPPVKTTIPADGIDPSAQVADSAKVHSSAVIGADVVIGENTCIMPGVVVMPGTTIGSDCVLHASVTLYAHTRIGDRVTIHAGSVLGSHGFGYKQHQGRHLPTGQLGFVQVDSDVEIGAGVTIDRGTYGSTRIGEGTKIDNQVMIAHNCQIGRHNLICSQVGVAGSCSTGDYVILAGQVGLKDHVHLGNHVIVGAQAGVMTDLDDNNVYLGSPATTQREQMQIMAVERRLPDMRRELKQLQRELRDLKMQLKSQESHQMTSSNLTASTKRTAA